jgi:hypothetical protein
MSFNSLAIHGLSAISVFADTVLVRMLIGAAAFGLLTLGLLGVVVTIKFATDLAIPGWTSYVAASLTIMLTQAILIGGLTLFQLLNLRSIKPFIPVSDVAPFIVDIWSPSAEIQREIVMEER